MGWLISAAYPTKACPRFVYGDGRPFPAASVKLISSSKSSADLLPAAISKLVANLGLSAGCCAQWRDTRRIDWGDGRRDGAAYPHAKRRDIEGAAAKGLHLPTDALAGTSSLHLRTERAQSQSHDD
jgi:hypothetical protein